MVINRMWTEETQGWPPTSGWEDGEWMEDGVNFIHRENKRMAFEEEMMSSELHVLSLRS